MAKEEEDDGTGEVRDNITTLKREGANEQIVYSLFSRMKSIRLAKRWNGMTEKNLGIFYRRPKSQL